MILDFKTYFIIFLREPWLWIHHTLLAFFISFPQLLRNYFYLERASSSLAIIKRKSYIENGYSLFSYLIIALHTSANVTIFSNSKGYLILIHAVACNDFRWKWDCLSQLWHDLAIFLAFLKVLFLSALLYQVFSVLNFQHLKIECESLFLIKRWFSFYLNIIL